MNTVKFYFTLLSNIAYERDDVDGFSYNLVIFLIHLHI